MNAPHTTQQAAPSIEDVASETAGHLLMDAADSIRSIIPASVNSSAEAILIAAHAIIAKLDYMEEVQLKELRDLRESIDFLSKTLTGQ